LEVSVSPHGERSSERVEEKESLDGNSMMRIVPWHWEIHGKSMIVWVEKTFYYSSLIF
jgi:hypothetical protein